MQSTTAPRGIIGWLGAGSVFALLSLAIGTIYASLGHPTWATGMVVALAILVLALGVGLTWWQRENRRLCRHFSERELAEQTLAEREARFRLLYEQAPIGYHSLNAEGQFLDVNPAWLDLMGYSREEVVGHWFGDFVSPDQRELFREQFAKYKAAEQARGTEFRMLKKDGSYILVSLDERIVRTVQGEFERTHGVVRDITARRMAEVALQESTRQLDAIFENAPVAMLLVDGGRTVRKANREALRLAGGGSADLIGKRVGDALRCVTSPNDIGGCGFGPACENCVLRRTVLDTFETGRSHSQVETTLTVARGEGVGVISLVISTTLLIASKERMVLLCAEDITERKQLESQLLQAEKMEAIGRLAGGIAHDFRNQLTIVKGYCELILRRSLIKSGEECLVGGILKAVDRGAELTGQLLAFSRKDMLQPGIVNLSQLVANLAGTIGRLAGEDILLSTSGGGPDCMVNLAAVQFEHTMMNLVANARDAMPRGGELTLETTSVDVDERSAAKLLDARVGPYVRVSVRDSGAGMDMVTKSRLFEPFFTTKERGKGTGLGLPMVYGFVRQSGGFINVESEPGKGTCFALHFPRISAAAKAGLPDVSLPGAGPGESPPRGTETILVVEDEEPIRWLVTHGLREAGYTVIEAGDARHAIEFADAAGARIDLLITDVIMPGMNGMELAAEVRKRRAWIPVLFVSGYDSETLAQRGLHLVNAELLVKPFDHTKLARIVRRMLDKLLDERPPVEGATIISGNEHMSEYRHHGLEARATKYSQP